MSMWKLHAVEARVRRTRLLFAALAMAASAGNVSAQVPGPYEMSGSDTLEQMVREAIVRATADGTIQTVGNRCQLPNALVTKGTCSVGSTPCSTTPAGGATCSGTCTANTDQSCATTAECASYNALSTCKATSQVFYKGGGSTTGETALRNNAQVWAPMSRNFTSSAYSGNFCTNAPTTSCASDAACPTAAAGLCQPRFWGAIEPRNVVALDAGVIVARQGGVKNIQLPAPPPPNDTEANPNTDPGNFSFLSFGTGYTQVLAIVLGGTDGRGTFASCSDPRRINAVNDLAFLNGNTQGTITHFWRRDDNSGTTDTFKEKLKIAGFCNGRAVGVNGTDKSNSNLNNQDNDPIRRPCDDTTGLTPPFRRSKCTDITGATPVACVNTTTNPSCTQGLVVALSVGDNDTNLADVTTTIGQRVTTDPESLGFAGREAVQSSFAQLNNAPPAIRTVTPDDTSVRKGQYMLGRRLFINFADADGDQFTSTNEASLNGTWNLAGNPDRRATEMAMWNWMSNTDANLGTIGRCHFDPIVKLYGFITCSGTCSDVAFPGDELCGQVAPFAASSAARCVPSGGNGGTPAWPLMGAANGGTCATGEFCCSTGTTCPASGVCDVLSALPLNSICGKNTDCLTGRCADPEPTGINHCAAKVANGSSCLQNADCVSNNCNPATFTCDP